MFTLALQVQNVSYELEVDEYLTVPDGKGDIVLKLHDLMADEFMQLDMVLSFDSAYDSYSSDQLSEAYKDDLSVKEMIRAGPKKGAQNQPRQPRSFQGKSEKEEKIQATPHRKVSMIQPDMI